MAGRELGVEGGLHIGRDWPMCALRERKESAAG